MNLNAISQRFAVAGVKHVFVKASASANVVTASSEDTLIGLWTGWDIIFSDPNHKPIPTKTGIKGTVPAKVLYNDDTGTYRAFTHTGDVVDWRKGFNRKYMGQPEESEIPLADTERKQ